MIEDQLVLLGKIAGIAGITVGALVLIFRSVIHKNFLSQMTQEQSYSITKSIIMFAGILAFAGLGSWIFLQVSGNSSNKTKLIVKGIVNDFDGNHLQNIKVILKSGNVILSEGTTDSEGEFNISHLGNGDTDGMIEISGQGYLPFTKNIELKYGDAVKEIGEVKLRSANPDDNKPIVNAPSQASPSSTSAAIQGSVQSTNNNVAQEGNSYITINTNEYGTLLSQFGASAMATLKIGGSSYTLTNIDLTIPFSSPGMIDYQITGYTTYMGQTICSNNSVGQIELAEGAKYYLFENLSNTNTTDCNWYLFNETQFVQQKSTLQQNISRLFQN